MCLELWKVRCVGHVEKAGKVRDEIVCSQTMMTLY